MINNVIEETAQELNQKIKKGTVHCTGAFYTKDSCLEKYRDEYNCKCVEMETFSLFYNAKKLNKKASCILTISDSFITNEKLTSQDREIGLNNMILLALETVLKLSTKE